MQDDHSPENDGEKNAGPLQFSLRRLFFWVTLSAILAAFFANGYLLPLSPLMILLILFTLVTLVAVLVLCVKDVLTGQPHNQTRSAIVVAVIWILYFLATAVMIPAL